MTTQEHSLPIFCRLPIRPHIPPMGRYVEITLLLLGTILILFNIHESNLIRNNTRVQYIPVPETFKYEQEHPAELSKIFSGMFNQIPFTGGVVLTNPSSPWYSSTYSEEEKNKK